MICTCGHFKEMHGRFGCTPCAKNYLDNRFDHKFKLDNLKYLELMYDKRK